MGHSVEQCRVIVALQRLAAAPENLKGLRGVQQRSSSSRPSRTKATGSSGKRSRRFSATTDNAVSIRWKDIFEALEDAIDACETAADLDQEHRRQERLRRRSMTDLVAVVAIALFFDFTNGFHDTANSIATSVSTRALSPR